MFAVLVVLVMSDAQHRRLDGRGPGPDGGGDRRDRHAHRLRGGDARPTSIPTSSPSPGTRRSTTSWRASPSRSSPSSASASSRSPPRTSPTRPRQLPRAMFLALGIATVVYVAVAIGVFGTLTVDEVIESGGTALAVAAEPVLGRAGYWMMTVTALFATAGATNAGLYPASGLCDADGGDRPVPAADGPARRRPGRDGPAVTAGRRHRARRRVRPVRRSPRSAASSPCSSSASCRSATSGCAPRPAPRRGSSSSPSRPPSSCSSSFVFTTLVDEPATAVALVVILALCVAIDALWKRCPSGARRVGRRSSTAVVSR